MFKLRSLYLGGVTVLVFGLGFFVFRGLVTFFRVESPIAVVRLPVARALSPLRVEMQPIPAQSVAPIGLINAPHADWGPARAQFYSTIGVSTEEQVELQSLRDDYGREMEPISERLANENLSAEVRARLVRQATRISGSFEAKVKDIIGAEKLRAMVEGRKLFDEKTAPLLRDWKKDLGVAW